LQIAVKTEIRKNRQRYLVLRFRVQGSWPAITKDMVRLPETKQNRRKKKAGWRCDFAAAEVYPNMVPGNQLMILFQVI